MNNPEETKHLLKQFSLFQICGYHEDISEVDTYLNSIISYFSIANFSEGEFIFKQSDSIERQNYLYFVLSGKVSLFEPKPQLTLNAHQKLHEDLIRFRKVLALLGRRNHDILIMKPFQQQMSQLMQELNLQSQEELAEVSEGNQILKEYFFSDFQQKVCYFSKKEDLGERKIIKETDFNQSHYSSTCLVMSKSLKTLKIEASIFYEQFFMKIYKLFFVYSSLKKYFDLKTSELFRIADQFTLKYFIDSVYEQGTQSQGIYILFEGKLSIISDNRQIKYIEEGELFGYQDLLEVRSSSVVVLNQEKVKVFYLNQEYINQNSIIMESILNINSNYSLEKPNHNNKSTYTSVSTLLNAKVQQRSKRLIQGGVIAEEKEKNEGSITPIHSLELKQNYQNQQVESIQISTILNSYKKLYSKLSFIFYQENQSSQTDFMQTQNIFDITSPKDSKNSIRRQNKLESSSQQSETNLLASLRKYYSKRNRQQTSLKDIDNPNSNNQYPGVGIPGSNIMVFPEYNSNERKFILKDGRKSLEREDQGLKKRINNNNIKDRNHIIFNEQSQSQTLISRKPTGNFYPMGITSVKKEQRSFGRQGRIFTKTSQAFYSSQNDLSNSVQSQDLYDSMLFNHEQSLTFARTQQSQLLEKGGVFSFSRDEESKNQFNGNGKLLEERINAFKSDLKSSTMYSKNQSSSTRSLFNTIQQQQRQQSQNSNNHNHNNNNNSLNHFANSSEEIQTKSENNNEYLTSSLLSSQSISQTQKNKMVIAQFLKQDLTVPYNDQNNESQKYFIDDCGGKRKSNLFKIKSTDQSKKKENPQSFRSNRTICLKQLMEGKKSSSIKYQFDCISPQKAKKSTQREKIIPLNINQQAGTTSLNFFSQSSPKLSFRDSQSVEKSLTQTQIKQPNLQNEDLKMETSSDVQKKVQQTSRSLNCVQIIFPSVREGSQESSQKISLNPSSPSIQLLQTLPTKNKFMPLSIRECLTSSGCQIDSSTFLLMRQKPSIISENSSMVSQNVSIPTPSSAKDKIMNQIQEKIISQNEKHFFQSQNQIKEQNKQISQAIEQAVKEQKEEENTKRRMNAQFSKSKIPLQLSDCYQNQNKKATKNGEHSLFENLALNNAFSTSPIPDHKSISLFNDRSDSPETNTE